jgi:hypothetical protein
MFPIKDDTSAATWTSVPVADLDGRQQLVVIARWTFLARPGCAPELIEPTTEIDLIDTFHSDDGARSSIRRPSMLWDFKPGTDVVLLGHAHAPSPGLDTEVDVSLRVGSIRKTVRAHGLRTWKYSAFGGVSPGPARAIRDPIPLIYELAWGGQDLSDPEKPIGEPCNYVGRGVTRTPKALLDQPAALLEYPDRPIGSGKNIPAAFNPVHRHWLPRASFAGTYDAAWSSARMPLLPRDFDPRFNVCVAHDQWSPTPLRGDETIDVLNATPEGTWRIELPRIHPGFSSTVQRRQQDHRTYLDTIVIDADAHTVELIWRAVIPLPIKWEMLERVLITEKQVLS